MLLGVSLLSDLTRASLFVLLLINCIDRLRFALGGFSHLMGTTTFSLNETSLTSISSTCICVKSMGASDLMLVSVLVRILLFHSGFLLGGCSFSVHGYLCKSNFFFVVFRHLFFFR